MKERAVRFGAWRTLVGMVCEPGAEAVEVGPALLLLNAGLLHNVGPKRTYVRLARRLSGLGFTSLRFDLSGVGDSGQRRDQMSRYDSVVAETREAMDYMSQYHGKQQFILCGICSGADQAFRTARADPRVVGLVLIDGYQYPTTGTYLQHYGRRLFCSQTWANVLSGRHPMVAKMIGRLRGERAEDAPQPLGLFPLPPREEVEAALQDFLKRDLHSLHIFTPSERYNHSTQFKAQYPSIALGPRVQLEYLDSSNHTFTLLASQERLIERISRWVQQITWPRDIAESGVRPLKTGSKKLTA